MKSKKDQQILNTPVIRRNIYCHFLWVMNINKVKFQIRQPRILSLTKGNKRPWTGNEREPTTEWGRGHSLDGTQEEGNFPDYLLGVSNNHRVKQLGGPPYIQSFFFDFSYYLLLNETLSRVTSNLFLFFLFLPCLPVQTPHPPERPRRLSFTTLLINVTGFLRTQMGTGRCVRLRRGWSFFVLMSRFSVPSSETMDKLEMCKTILNNRHNLYPLTPIF